MAQLINVMRVREQLPEPWFITMEWYLAGCSINRSSPATGFQTWPTDSEMEASIESKTTMMEVELKNQKTT